MMYCTQCKIEAKATAKFCPRCGGRLVSQTTPEIQTMQCPQCGKIYGTDKQFCADDGSQLQPRGTSSDSSPKPLPKASVVPVLKIVFLILALLFFVALGTGGYLYFSGRWMDIPMLAKWPPLRQKVLKNGTYDKTRDSKVSADGRSNMSAIAEEGSLADRFCGIWEYVENTSKNYLKIIKEKPDRFKFFRGHKYQGEILWQEPMLKNADGIYLQLINGKLQGEFVSSNFYATHGQDFTFRITLDIKSNGKLLYSVWCSIRGGETDEYEAARLSETQLAPTPLPKLGTTFGNTNNSPGRTKSKLLIPLDKVKIYFQSLFSNKSSIDNLYPIKQRNKYGFINKKGEIKIPPQFDYALPFSEGLAAVESGNKWGYIDNAGKYLINPQFKSISPFSEGLALVTINKKEGYIDKTGKVVINPIFASSFGFSEGVAPVNIGGSWGYIDKEGNYLIKPQFESCGEFSEGLAPVRINHKWFYIDKEGKVVIEPKFDNANSFSEGLALVFIGPGRDGGYIDKTGRFVINPEFFMAMDFSDGLAAVCPDFNFKWGYIDKEGRVVIKPKFDNANSFSEGLAAIRIGNKYGYIDKTGKIVINPQFDYADKFSEGLAEVKIGEKIGYIDKTGRYIWKPTD